MYHCAQRLRDVGADGFAPSLTTTLPYSIADDLGPVPVEFRVSPANRQIREIIVDWRVQDMLGAVMTKGHFELPLADGEPAKRDFAWAPPRFGWYTVTAEMSHRGHRLRAIGKHFGVTPRFPGMVTLAEGESIGGWADAPRQMFSGLTNIRLHCGHSKESRCDARCTATCWKRSAWRRNTTTITT